MAQPGIILFKRAIKFALKLHNFFENTSYESISLYGT